ncbi:signal transducer and activator of transcription 5B-like [Contarinia nasturtii]|uniref:signal transducer and activator of transcription 5B-like n=1 Tax=Contarinia nasturtii TaxID=265458 RepID=UPI0012D4AFD1|nr:signal transducer and activator of transcription 5B-like [Contarinia nasturtii]
MTSVQNIVIYTRLSQWKRDQILSGYGEWIFLAQTPQSPLDANSKNACPKSALDKIQTWFVELFTLIWQTRTLIDLLIHNTYIPHNEHVQFETQALKDITCLLRSLITSSFIIEKQPPQVIKKETKFAARVRLLLPNIIKNQSPPLPLVAASILSESQLHKQLRQLHPLTESTGEIEKNTGPLEWQNDHQNLKCHLNHMKATFKRSEKNRNERVLDHKSVILFQTTLQIGDIQFNVWQVSVPVVFITNINQEPRAQATIVWDNAFARGDRVPFMVCFHFSRTPSEKIYRNSSENAENLEISWYQFGMEKLPGCSFTFWDWFYDCMHLIREHLSEPWNEGLIVGFISRNAAKEMLEQCTPGTFLFRLSDSEKGSISISWIEETENQERRVESLIPLCHRTFDSKHTIIPLKIGDLIKDVEQYVYLYNFPNQSKTELFQKYCTQVDERSPKVYYVLPHCKIEVPTKRGRQLDLHSFEGLCENSNGDVSLDNIYPSYMDLF